MTVAQEDGRLGQVGLRCQWGTSWLRATELAGGPSKVWTGWQEVQVMPGCYCTLKCDEINRWKKNGLYVAGFGKTGV